jgi:hypothetical protein
MVGGRNAALAASAQPLLGILSLLIASMYFIAMKMLSSPIGC